MSKFVKVLVSFGGVGYAPVPGTCGSLAAFVLIWPLYDFLPYLTLFTAVLGLLLCKPAQDAFKHKDPKQFVLDEVCGMCLSLVGLPQSPVLALTAFVLFRALDVFKPWPIVLWDRGSKPLNIMWDDIAAGVGVNVILRVFMHFF